MMPIGPVVGLESGLALEQKLRYWVYLIVYHGPHLF